MKTTRIAFIVVGSLFLIFFIVSLLLPSRYEVEREIEIKAALERVYGLVANFKEWSSWSPQYRKEPLAEYLYAGTVQTVGALMSWRGQDIGEGTITLVELNPPFTVSAEYILEKPSYERSLYSWVMDEADGGRVSKVKWVKSGELTFPFQRWSGLWISKRLGPEMEQGLSQLKQVAELRPFEPTREPLEPFPGIPSPGEN